MSKAVHCIVSNRPSTLPKLLASIIRVNALPQRRVHKIDFVDLSNLPILEPVRNVPLEHYERIPIKFNEPHLKYKLQSAERKLLKFNIDALLALPQTVPIVIKNQTYETESLQNQMVPHDYKICLAEYYHADKKLLWTAIDEAVKTQSEWAQTSLDYRLQVWEKAAELISTKYRFHIVAAIMLGQGKTVVDAEADVSDLVDHLRLSPIFLRELANTALLNYKPTQHRNFFRLRSLNGFVAAITPFNFTSIAGNMVFTPALMGNCVIWKPSDNAIISNWLVYKVMCEAGLPDGVVSFVPCSPQLFGRIITGSAHLAGINFTGKASNFKSLWQQTAQSINIYESFPRLVGECGGKNFHFVHESADPETVVACTIRSAFGYAGQKCSSCSMLYVPQQLWEKSIQKLLVDQVIKLKVDATTDYNSFHSAVINNEAYQRIFTYLNYARNNINCKVLVGAGCCMSTGYYIQPTVIEITDLTDRLCVDEILGPVLCVYVYKEPELKDILKHISKANSYLSGAVFATDNNFLRFVVDILKPSVGTLNVNDKTTDAMVARQPFSGGGLTGTNDKAGSPEYLLRWASPQIIKETYTPQTEILYPHMSPYGINVGAAIKKV